MVVESFAAGGGVEPTAGGEMLFGEFAPWALEVRAPTTAMRTIATSAGA